MDDLLISELPDTADVPMHCSLYLSAEDYARVMRRIGVYDDADGAPLVSAFNSSIT